VDSEKQPVSTFVTETTAELQPIGPWDAYALSILMKRLAHAPETTQRAAGDPFSMVLRSDANTRFMARDASMKDFCVVDAILDFEASASASMAAEKLSAEIAAKKASQ
jgi:hypothetical protein